MRRIPDAAPRCGWKNKQSGCDCEEYNKEVIRVERDTFTDCQHDVYCSLGTPLILPWLFSVVSHCAAIESTQTAFVHGK